MEYKNLAELSRDCDYIDSRFDRNLDYVCKLRAKVMFKIITDSIDQNHPEAECIIEFGTEDIKSWMWPQDEFSRHLDMFSLDCMAKCSGENLPEGAVRVYLTHSSGTTMAEISLNGRSYGLYVRKILLIEDNSHP